MALVTYKDTISNSIVNAELISSTEVIIWRVGTTRENSIFKLVIDLEYFIKMFNPIIEKHNQEKVIL